VKPNCSSLQDIRCGQYTTGIQGAETIVAINRDPHAPIFKMADLGLVGDAKAVLSLLLEKLRKRL